MNDNPLLEQASQQVDRLICLYCYPSITPFLARYAQQTQWGEAKKRFLNQTLADLDHSLSTLGQKLWVTPLLPYQALRHLLTQVEITDIYVDAVAGSDERQAIARIHQDFSSVHIHQQALHSLLSEPQLPFALEALPSTFTQFRKQVETISLSAPMGYPHVLPPIEQGWQLPLMDIVTEPNHSAFVGGEQAGLTHCQNYFSSLLPSRYKETRNGLDGMDYSTKFSPWLALGAVSPKTIYAMLQRYEAVHARTIPPTGFSLSYCGVNIFTGTRGAMAQNCFASLGLARKTAHQFLCAALFTVEARRNAFPHCECLYAATESNGLHVQPWSTVSRQLSSSRTRFRLALWCRLF